MMIKFTRHVAQFSLAWIACSILATGCVCVVHQRGTMEPQPVYVRTPPPAVRVETKADPPSSVHVWIDGYWDYNSAEDGWEWREGSWQIPPDEGVTWQTPSYEDRGEGNWVYVPGYWSHPKHRGHPKKHGSHKEKHHDPPGHSKADRQKVSVAKPADAQVEPADATKADRQKVSVAKPADAPVEPEEETVPGEPGPHGKKYGDGKHPVGKRTHYDERGKDGPHGKKYGDGKHPVGEKKDYKKDEKGPYGKKYGDGKHPVGEKKDYKKDEKGPYGKKYGDGKHPVGKKKDYKKDKPAAGKAKPPVKDATKPKKVVNPKDKNKKPKKVKEVDTRKKPGKVIPRRQTQVPGKVQGTINTQ